MPFFCSIAAPTFLSIDAKHFSQKSSFVFSIKKDLNEQSLPHLSHVILYEVLFKTFVFRLRLSCFTLPSLFFFVVGVEVDLFEVFRLFAGTDFLDAFCFTAFYHTGSCHAFYVFRFVSRSSHSSFPTRMG